MNSKLNSIQTGQSFCKLIVTGPRIGEYVPVTCECGMEKMARIYALLEGRAKSCGRCLKRERTKHGSARRGAKFSREYKAWRAMIRRCTDTRLLAFRNYGGRGITVCARWSDPMRGFLNFQEDMGICPDGHTLHRKHNDKGYSPDNCKWADVIEQANNKQTNVLVELRGVVASVTEHCRKYEIKNYATVLWRINSGWKPEEAFFSPFRLP